MELCTWVSVRASEKALWGRWSFAVWGLKGSGGVRFLVRMQLAHSTSVRHLGERCELSHWGPGRSTSGLTIFLWGFQAAYSATLIRVEQLKKSFSLSARLRQPPWLFIYYMSKVVINCSMGVQPPRQTRALTWVLCILNVLIFIMFI